MTEAVRRKCRNGLSGRWQPRSGQKLIGRCSDPKINLVVRATVRTLRHEGAAGRAQGGVGGTDKALDSGPCPLSSALVCPPSTACMRRGAPQDQELVGPGAPGRGSRGAPPPSGLVPVLVFPPDLVFRADQRSGPRQLLTLYNPTGAALRFRVLCTAPAKYTVFDAEGYVKPQSCIDMRTAGLGRRGAGASDEPCSPDRHPQLATSSFLLFLLTGIVSVAFLLLPLQDELGSQLPQILHVSLGQKLVAAYVLGLLTMVFLRT
ncbi:motile sperm domain-containing protein 3 isoform X3 [Ailuropoda melanoleuca]|uniref:motile sperm domain-containing protein 3 isoform X3 n=1 Tax=Ailuropoda melanoleuca TaxID=9646 RepID=UPI0014942294|nr:motile sperm domain-containing protein 3 isoform X3 [Ailuropoda melanoleuca]